MNPTWQQIRSKMFEILVRPIGDPNSYPELEVLKGQLERKCLELALKELKSEQKSEQQCE